MIRNRLLVAIVAISTMLVLSGGDTWARAGGGFSGGSRGMRTFSPPPVTSTAPNTASPIQRTLTQPGTAGTLGQAAARPGGLFGGGLLGGLAAGFLGAGLFGLLFGHGLFGGLAGFASLLGLIFQIVLIVMVARLLFAWWQRRSEPAYAAAHPATGHSFSGLGGMLAANPPSGEPLTIGKSDYDAFERLLGEIQAAYSAEDLDALRSRVTPEMLSYFSQQLSENASRGLVNKISGIKLEQGDLAEAWREGGVDYATVAMRFALVDQMIERASGRTVDGGGPGEATELWTFMRARNGEWLLSAIQQT
ncbi:MAG TPA: TIM44-like domain-containing protein [Pseudolabrys sp.]|nr:TIM44-like domain-containing protein [Pseudolabrys sp.]